jgi:hypothetical protein
MSELQITHLDQSNLFCRKKGPIELAERRKSTGEILFFARLLPLKVGLEFFAFLVDWGSALKEIVEVLQLFLEAFVWAHLWPNFSYLNMLMIV